jgi:hypothetical protein
VQNKIVFLPLAFGKLSTKANVSFAGLAPSTGVPKIIVSKASTTDGLDEVMLKIGALKRSAIASANRLVFPVREKYTTQGFMVDYIGCSVNITLVFIVAKDEVPSKLNNIDYPRQWYHKLYIQD